MQRIDDTPVHKALRECLTNALIHADYYGRRGIVIDKEFRKISISNPGTFRISVDEAIAGGISDARKGRIFTLINVGERSGTGLCIWEGSGFKRPELIETVDPDRITLTLEIKLDSAIKHDGENDGETVGEYADLNKTQYRVYEEIKKGPTAPAEDIAKLLGVSRPTIERAISVLKKKGYIIRDGGAKGGKWTPQK